MRPSLLPGDGRTVPGRALLRLVQTPAPVEGMNDSPTPTELRLHVRDHDGNELEANNAILGVFAGRLNPDDLTVELAPASDR